MAIFYHRFPMNYDTKHDMSLVLASQNEFASVLCFFCCPFAHFVWHLNDSKNRFHCLRYLSHANKLVDGLSTIRQRQQHQQQPQLKQSEKRNIESLSATTKQRVKDNLIHENTRTHRLSRFTELQKNYLTAAPVA